jgi:hypothetical protein
VLAGLLDAGLAAGADLAGAALGADLAGADLFPAKAVNDRTQSMVIIAKIDRNQAERGAFTTDIFSSK